MTDLEDSWMFRELSPAAPGLAEALQGFSNMLLSGRRVVELASQALLGKLAPAACRDEVFNMEQSVDALERSIRRRITVHAMAYAGEQVPLCLGLMSVIKDAERISDYGTALFRLSELLGTGLTGERRLDVQRVAEQVLTLLEQGRQSLQTRDASAAETVIRQCSQVRDHCSGVVQALVQGPAKEPQAVAYALAYQRLRRIASHLRNIQTALVQPLEKLDFLP
jgi:phosphate uptake regulator